MNVVSRTHVGNVRPSNQDTLLIQPGLYGLFGVADGMGGHKAGDVASQMAVAHLSRALDGKKPDEKLLRNGMEEANRILFEEQKNNVDLSGMGTTFTVIWEDEDRILLGHVGDSRAYLLREGHLRQVTQDHSMVADMVRRGLLTEEQASTHPMRNYITRAVGTEPTIQADILSLERQAGDQWLVCSDGLHGLLSREDLERLMTEPNLEEAADEMLRLALDRGGRDNISLLLAREDQAGEVAE